MIKKLLKFFAQLFSKNMFESPLDVVLYICGNDALPLPLDPEQEQILLEELARDNGVARERLIEHNLRLVVFIAKKFDNTGMELEDLISIGAIGLIKAIKTFNVDKNIKLATYASRCIENEILMHLRKTAPQRGEISIEEPLNTDWDGNELLLSDVLGTDPDIIMRPIEDEADRRLLRKALEKLSEREREIIVMRFGLDGNQERTQKEVADKMGISQSYISRLEKRIILRLRREINRIM